MRRKRRALALFDGFEAPGNQAATSFDHGELRSRLLVNEPAVWVCVAEFTE